ncbi:MFS transporter [Candidatus Halobonum tyrrellensis]|uniref:Major facilitator superfamily protein n=1 Tax=Candidatus Halobonum tyrrellensis G22 TaxID=1324957 RepID=V4HHW3_9EURY|nr:MFS transporter [Candidatus Halobonum tyrrellensis]ESP87499.1 major facilitator superfamily protein [Candidatus Halobonum tyrrellensis G22]
MSTPRAATASEAEVPTGSRRAVAVVIGVVFLDLLGFGVVIPVLPFYVRSFGVSDVFIGLLAASYSLAQFLAAPTLGRLSDRRGRRPVITLSVVVAAVAWTVFGLAAEVEAVAGTTAALATLFASRTLAGAAGGNIAAAQAYVADVTPRERRAGALGLVGAAFSLGFVFGPALGGVAASDPVVAAAREFLPSFVPATRFSLPSFLAAGLSVSAAVAATVVLREPERTRPAAERVSLVGQFRSALADADLRPLVTAFFLVSLAFAGIQVMFIPFAADFYGYDATGAALFLTYIGVLGTVNQGVLVGRLERRLGAVSLALAGGVSLAAALALLPFSPDVGRLLPAVGGPAWLTGGLVALLFAGFLLSFGNGALSVSLSTLVSTRASDETQGAAFGVTQGAGSLGRTVGPPLAGVAYVLAYWSPFVAGAVVLLPVLAWLAAERRRGAGSADRGPPSE